MTDFMNKPVWLRGDDESTVASLRKTLEDLDIELEEDVLFFPGRIVVMARACYRDLVELLESSDHIAELRRAKETAHFFTALENQEQVKWAEDLVDRLETDPDSTVSICVLDTGINQGHMLLTHHFTDEDCQAVDPEWGANDHHGHGTMMGGIAVYGNLQASLETRNRVRIPHKLESVKILPPGDQENHPRLYGWITSKAINKAEIQAPERQRIIALAVTANDEFDRGRPSSWSAMVDLLATGSELGDHDAPPRLIIVSAGNVTSLDDWKNYPESNEIRTIQDPGQAWNALTVGAYTEKVRILDPTAKRLRPMARIGALSPFSTTSVSWDKEWPVKPDLVAEGGNLAEDADGFASALEDLSVLTTSHEPFRRQLTCCNATSAATAQVAWMAAQLQSEYPDAWPETLRALMVHSASWTPEMMNTYVKRGKNKTEYRNLLRTCGYGVPDLNRASKTASNSLTMIVQDEIQPYEKKKGSTPKTRDMHLHELPWPRETLRELGETHVELRITLSYFIEPGPGEVGWRDRYRYPSHGLKFDLVSPGERRETFIKRINAAARAEGEKNKGSSQVDRWMLGANNRSKGSIHSDVWEGLAIDIADCNLVAVFPIIGWWRERHHLGRCNNQTRYVLVVSLSTPSEHVDLYTPVKVALETPIEI